MFKQFSDIDSTGLQHGASRQVDLVQRQARDPLGHRNVAAGQETRHEP